MTIETIDDILAEETPEERAYAKKKHAEYKAALCKFGRHDGECYVHGYMPRRCEHTCHEAAACAICGPKPMTGRRRTRARWKKQGRRGG